MRFRVEHEFPASPHDVAVVLCAGAFHVSVDLPDLGRPEIVEESVAGSVRTLRCRYTFVGQLDPVARRLLGNRRLTWLQELQVDTGTGRGRLSFAAEGGADRLFGSAEISLESLESLESAGGERTCRRLEGELVVKVPLLGGQAERRIVPGLVRRLDVEARALTAALTREP